MGLPAIVILAALLPQKPPTDKAANPAMQPEVVLAASGDPVPLAEFGLGDGGIADERSDLRWSDDGCTTPGGVRIECRTVGVKLTFPSGRELLVAPDGHLHLRSGEFAGPFASGLELRLGDGAVVRVALAPGSRERLREVTVLSGERALQPWRRGKPSVEVVTRAGWGGVRLCCCGDGGDLFRAIALGPLVVLDRVLVAGSREAMVPSQRLVVLTAPLRQSLSTMQRQHREADADVRRAVTAIAAVADRADGIFPAGAGLQRSEADRLRWLLRGGFELQLDLEGPAAPRLALFAGNALRPMVEWTLNADAAAFLSNPDPEAPDARWHGNGTRLPRTAVDLQARSELEERVYALRILGRLRRAGDSLRR
ncbi:MAG: hypothetical protein JNK78_07495 [Planctomycetes bacterium]|nr:hypothetical protein [Planctomycetota bacterium]